MQPENLKIENAPDVPFIYRVMDADAVIASHIAYTGFSKNPVYPYENERLYHTETASQAKVLNNARSLDPDRLLVNNIPASGAPIIDRKGNVLGGNSRAMSIQYAIDKFPARYASYKARVIEFSQLHGIFVDENILNPILVREIQEDVDKARAQALISLLNNDPSASRDKRADAKSRGARFSVATLKALATGFGEVDSLRAFFDSPESLPIVQRILRDGVISPLESNEYLDNQGYLRPEGKTLVESALRSRVFTSYESLASISAPMLAKIDAVIPSVIMAGQVKGWDISAAISGATDLILEFGNNEQKERFNFLKQTNMFKTAPCERFNALEIAIFLMLFEKGKKEFQAIFKAYAYQASISPEAGGFGVGISHKEAIKKFFGVAITEPETIETETTEVKEMNINEKIIICASPSYASKEGSKDLTVAENPVTVAADCATQEGNAPDCQPSETPKKARKARERKNDCDKQNSAFVAAKNDMGELIDFIGDEIFYGEVVLVANSKTQFRVLRDGAEIDGYRVIRSGRQWQLRLLNGYDAFIFESIDSNSDASEIYEDAEIDSPENGEIQEEAETATIESRINEIYCELERLGWQRCEIGVKRNLQGGFRVSINPHGKRIFTIYDADNEMAIVFGTKIYSAEIFLPMNTEALAQELNKRAIEYARQSGEYKNPETLDGVLTENVAPKAFIGIDGVNIPKCGYVAPSRPLREFQAIDGITLAQEENAPTEKRARVIQFSNAV